MNARWTQNAMKRYQKYTAATSNNIGSARTRILYRPRHPKEEEEEHVLLMLLSNPSYSPIQQNISCGNAAVPTVGICCILWGIFSQGPLAPGVSPCQPEGLLRLAPVMLLAQVHMDP